jgi:hypothetical protein
MLIHVATDLTCVRLAPVNQYRLTTGDDEMKTDIGKFSFKVPETHAQAGEKITKGFEFQVCETETEAQAILTAKKWTLTDMVNEALKANARSNAYQSATLVYRPSEVSPADVKERMIRDFIRLGVGEEIARKQVESLLAQSATTTEDTDESDTE